MFRQKFVIDAGSAQRAPVAVINLTFYLIISVKLAVRNAIKPAFPYIFSAKQVLETERSFAESKRRQEHAAAAILPFSELLTRAVPPASLMSLSLTDIARLAKLAQLDLSEQQASDTLAKLNDIFSLVEQMKAVDTTGVEPLSHPVAAWRNDLAMPLREDRITEPNRRDDYQQPAPMVQDGLYLVPKVIE